MYDVPASAVLIYPALFVALFPLVYLFVAYVLPVLMVAVPIIVILVVAVAYLT